MEVEQMNKEKWLQFAKTAGLENFEIYEQGKISTSIRLFEGSIDGFTISECNGIALRGVYNGKMGICFLEEDSDDGMEYAISQVKQNASVITSKDDVSIYDGKDEKYPELQMSEVLIANNSIEEKVELLKQIEKQVLASDERISQVMATTYGQVDVRRAIDNTLGVHVEDTQQAAFISCALMAKEKEDVKTAADWAYVYDKRKFDIAAFVSGLRTKVLDKLHAETLESGTYKVLMQKEAMAEFLSVFVTLFDGEAAHKGISILKQKVHEKIFSSKVQIVDNPLLYNGYNSARFDDEGVACRKKNIVEKGVLTTYLHNIKSGKLMNTSSTGNGFKNNYSGNVGIAPTNFYIEPGEASFEELIKNMDCGVIIHEVAGLHAGVNPISTNFSIQSSGFYVEGGKIVRPVNMITIAGVFMDVMKHICAIGNDLKMGATGIGSPSILFEQMAISGKNKQEIT